MNQIKPRKMFFGVFLTHEGRTGGKEHAKCPLWDYFCKLKVHFLTNGAGLYLESYFSPTTCRYSSLWTKKPSSFLFAGQLVARSGGPGGLGRCKY